MNEIVEKSAKKVKDQIELWFFGFFGKEKSDFNGTELFTLFDLIPKSEKIEFIKKMDLEKNEIPVLILKVSESEFIINSTHKFVLLDSYKTEFLEYSEFERHKGFKAFVTTREEGMSVKQNGYLADFKIIKNNGEIITRKIPTGEPGFAFWNVTKKCELIGRKYKIT
ncbi:hypothetical protein AWE51_25790 [Aquimarina aggregata]|uniref:Uncharacterized protein n=1 Tax=Aquimarina aggregata TaxID=1642818 RepID=A0A162Z1Q0_9FLAO|nr:hypothetical protein [Aquimarina aggregata]KZS39497.1 hypothetical protein AWE51_25790 [Aquimarina aggregata]